MEEFDGQGGDAKKSDSFMKGAGYHKYPEITEIPGGWF